MKILNKWTLSIIFENEKETLRETLIDALKEGAYLSGADLRGADLSDADLSGAYLRGAKNIKSFQCGECNRISFAIKWESEVMFKIGCFWGNTEKAISKVKEKYGENSYYEKLIKLYTEMLEEGKLNVKI